MRQFEQDARQIPQSSLTLAMKTVVLSSLLALASSVSAHYTFPELIVGGKGTGAWKYVRQTANYQSNGPVTDVTSNAIRCYPLAPGTSASTYTVNVRWQFYTPL